MTTLPPSPPASRRRTDKPELQTDALAWIGEPNASLLHTIKLPSLGNNEETEERNQNKTQSHTDPSNKKLIRDEERQTERSLRGQRINCHRRQLLLHHKNITRRTLEETMTTQLQKKLGTRLLTDGVSAETTAEPEPETRRQALSLERRQTPLHTTNVA